MMRRDSDGGFTIVELLISTGTLLALLTCVLGFFSRGQTLYNNERETLDMVQDTRTAFDRFTDEVRMAGAGLPGYRGVISGSQNSLVVRGDFNNLGTIVTSTSPISGGTFPVGSTAPFAVDQTVSLLSVEGATAGHAALAKITAIDANAKTLTVNVEDAWPLTAGAQIATFGAGTLINVIERRTYRAIADSNSADVGAITRQVVFESTQSTGATIQAEEIIARNVLTADGQIGLTFTYFDASDNELEFDETTGLVDQSRVAKVRINLDARSLDRDLQSKEYRVLRLSSLIQVRGQYIPAVGF
jgi:Tfp pilus assembly protein PilW